MDGEKPNFREFDCFHCGGKIRVPANMPPIMAPCPHCGKLTHSPGEVKLPGKKSKKAGEVESAPLGAGALGFDDDDMPLPKKAGPIQTLPGMGDISLDAPSSPEMEGADTRRPIILPDIDPSKSASFRTPKAPVSLSSGPVAEEILTPLGTLVTRSTAEVDVSTENAGGSEEEWSPDQERPLLKEKEKKKSSPIVLVVGVAALVLLGGGAFLFFTKGKKDVPSPIVVKPNVGAQPQKPSGATGSGAQGGQQTAPTLVKPNVPKQPELTAAEYAQGPWKEDARKALSSFLSAKTVKDKAESVIAGDSRDAMSVQMQAFYGAQESAESDTPVDQFQFVDLPQADREKGLFMMKFEAPVTLVRPDLATGVVANEPVKVLVFFRKTLSGLKVDWESFVQTKYRLLNGFASQPKPDKKQVFRVFVREDTAQPAAGGSKAYRFVDPAHNKDSVRVEVLDNSPMGQILAQSKAKTATIELGWSADGSKVEVTKFICWEFLYLGGRREEGN